MKVSVVINTLNRRDMLDKTLRSFRHQRYRNFEVVVVNGPSVDGTDELLAQWSNDVRLYNCEQANLSVSRNIGIAAATGDVVAFIDDDAVPDPQWLQRIVGAYDRDDIGAVGGMVYDHTGYQFQTKYILADRFGGAESNLEVDPTLLYNFPGSTKYVALLGTNSTFRRQALLEVGGFDEEYAYYLDETDLCLRIVDRGYAIKFADGAFVYHKFAPSSLRDHRRVVRNRYEILKNQAYFAFRHGAPATGSIEAMAAIQRFVDHNRGDVRWCTEHGLLPAEALETFELDVVRATRDGIARAQLAPKLGLLSHDLAAEGLFKKFAPTFWKERQLTICFFSTQYPPGPVDGIARFVYEIAQELTARGCKIHVLTRSKDHSTVDLEGDVWVHRLKVEHQDGCPDGVPRHIWDSSQTFMKEVKRIQEFEVVDIVHAPDWDCESLAALMDGSTRVVVSLNTPMLVAASMHPAWLSDSITMEQTIVPICRWERRILMAADAFYANSNGIIRQIETEYNVEIDKDRTRVVLRGLADRAVGHLERTFGRRVLFVGRLEYRKGIDVLLNSIKTLMPRYDDLVVDIVGRDPEVQHGRSSFRQKLSEEVGRVEWLERVRFWGEVQQEHLDDFIRACDVFVAPSRFESFGLIYLEAMMHGKPVIGTDAGGIPEVVDHGRNGLLVPPGDETAFTDALAKLLDSLELREQFGRAGRARYESHFTSGLMADNTLEFYGDVMARPKRARTDRISLPVAKRCELQDFWAKSPLFPILLQIDETAINWQVWAYALSVYALQSTVDHHHKLHAGKLRVLVISKRPLSVVKLSGADFVYVHLDNHDSATTGNPHSSYRTMDRLGFSDAHFDCVCLLDPLQGLAPDFVSKAREMARITKAGGHLLLTLSASSQSNALGAEIRAELHQAGVSILADLASVTESAGSESFGKQPTALQHRTPTGCEDVYLVECIRR